MRAVLTTIIFAILINSCAKPPLKSYMFSTPKVAKQSPIFKDKIVKVDYPKSVEDGSNVNIYYFNDSNLTRSYYKYHQWSLPLNRLVMAHIIETLIKSHLFKNVIDYSSKASSNYLLETTIYKFSQEIKDKCSYADISINLRLIDSRDGSLIKSRYFNYKIKTDSIDAPSFVKASNEAMKRFSRDLIKWLRKQDVRAK